MRAYDWVWRQVAAVFSVVGLFGSAATMGWPSTLVLFACAAAMGFLAALTYAMVEPLDVWSWIWIGLASGSLTVGGLGSICLFGPMGLAALAALGLAAPWTVRRARRLWQNPPSLRDVLGYLDPGADEDPRSALEHAPDPARPAGRDSGHDLGREAVLVPSAMSDGELCATWRRSFVRLQRARDAEVRLQVVRLRAECLEELERRHPRAVRAWLASGTRASGDPTPFITARHVAADPPVDDLG